VTYPASRSLQLGAPDQDGAVTLDFNLPCAYTEFATCPLPPAGNRLPIPVQAGEKTPARRTPVNADRNTCYSRTSGPRS